MVQDHLRHMYYTKMFLKNKKRALSIDSDSLVCTLRGTFVINIIHYQIQNIKTHEKKETEVSIFERKDKQILSHAIIGA